MTPTRNAFLTVAILLYACNTSYVQAEGGRKNNVPEKREAISMPDTSLRGTLDRQRLIVTLRFDFDAESYWVGSAKMTSPSAISRGTYGAREGIPKIQFSK